MCSPNSKGQIKDNKNEKKFSYVRDISFNPKEYLNLKDSQDHSLIAIIGPSGKSPIENEDFGPKVTSMLWT